MAKRKPEKQISLSDFYQRFRLLNREAFDLEQYDVAYHSLMAALHCAQSLEDATWLIEVQRIASEQMEWIDNHHPEYHHSTKSASERGNASIFHNLITQAKTGVVIVQNKKNQTPGFTE